MVDPTPEPRLADLLRDDTLRLLMDRDGVTDDALLALLGRIRRLRRAAEGAAAPSRELA